MTDLTVRSEYKKSLSDTDASEINIFYVITPPGIAKGTMFYQAHFDSALKLHYKKSVIVIVIAAPLTELRSLRA